MPTLFAAGPSQRGAGLSISTWKGSPAALAAARIENTVSAMTGTPHTDRSTSSVSIPARDATPPGATPATTAEYPEGMDSSHGTSIPSSNPGCGTSVNRRVRGPTEAPMAAPPTRGGVPAMAAVPTMAA